MIYLNCSQNDGSCENINFKNNQIPVISEDNEKEDGKENLESSYDEEDQANKYHDQVNTLICEDNEYALLSNDDNDDGEDSSVVSCKQKPSHKNYFDSKIVLFANQETIQFNQKEYSNSIYYSKPNLCSNLIRTYIHPKMNEFKQVIQTLDGQRYKKFWQTINAVDYVQGKLYVLLIMST